MTHHPTNWTSRICLILAFGLALGICGKAKAEGVIGVHTLSAHVPQHDQNNANWGLYARSSSQWELGAYRNSIDRNSAYLAKGFDLAQGAYGTLGLQVGAAYGYQEKCESTVTTVPGKKHVDRRDDGSTLTTIEPATTNTHTDCRGFSRGAVTPLAGLTYAAPFALLGVTPRIQFMPAMKNHSSVVHLNLETTWK